MNILHISDYHWSEKQSADQGIVVKSLLNDERLDELKGQIKFIVFSGDLVWSGNDAKNYGLAYDSILAKLQDKLGLDDDAVIICPGNHDVSQNSIVRAIEKGLLSDLNSSEALNLHIDEQIKFPYSDDFSQVRLKNYFDFVRPRFHKNAVFQSSYADALTFDISGTKIGFGVLNSAWRSTGVGEVERHKILLGERAVDVCSEKLSQCEMKVAVVHHPLDWLASWDQFAVETPLLSGFDIVIFGHVHVARPSMLRTPLGSAVLLQGGSIFSRRDFYNGYSIIDIDLETGSIEAECRTYFNIPRRFEPAVNLFPNGRIKFDLDKGSGKKN